MKDPWLPKYLANQYSGMMSCRKWKELTCGMEKTG